MLFIRSRRLHLGAAAAIALIGSPAFASDTAASASATAAAATAAAANAQGPTRERRREPRICVRMETTGSLLSPYVCRTADYWDRTEGLPRS